MCIKCGKASHIVMAMKIKDLEPELVRIAKAIHEGKMKPGDVDGSMISKIADQLMKAASEGFGKTFDDDLSRQEFSALRKIEENVYVFSGFKNHKQLQETSLLLKDGNGDLKPFKDFLSDVKAVDHTYNEVYLEAEYNNAIASTQAIDAWELIQADKEHTPNLTFRTSGSDRVCDICSPLDGLTAPVDDPIWNTYFWPLHFGCNCDTIQTDADPTGYNLNDLPELKQMFQTNVGKTGIVFPDTHPYFNEVSIADRKNIMNAVKEVLPDRKYEGDNE